MEHLIQDDDDTPYKPAPLTQAIFAAAIALTIGFALYGGATLIQAVIAGAG